MSPAETYCDRCNLQFSTSKELKRHKLRNPPPGRHNYCPVRDCGHDFKTKDGLERHYKQMHAHEQNLPCPGCEERFNRVGGLMGHLEFGNCPGMPNFRGLLYKEKKEGEEKPSAFDKIKAHGEAMAQQENMVITTSMTKSVATKQSTTTAAVIDDAIKRVKLESAGSFPPLAPQAAKPPKPEAKDFLGYLDPSALAPATPLSRTISPSNLQQLEGGLVRSRWATALPPITPLKPRVKVPEEQARAHTRFLDDFLTGVETDTGEDIGAGVGTGNGVGGDSDLGANIGTSVRTSAGATGAAAKPTKKEESQEKDGLLDFFLGDGWHQFIPTPLEATASQAAPAVHKSLQALISPAAVVDNQNPVIVTPSPQASTTQSNGTIEPAKFPQDSSNSNWGTLAAPHIVSPIQAKSVVSNAPRSVPPHLGFVVSDGEFPALGTQSTKTSAPQPGQYASVASRTVPSAVLPARTQTNNSTTASSVSKAPQVWSTASPTQTITSVNSVASPAHTSPQAWAINKSLFSSAAPAHATPPLVVTPPVDATPTASPVITTRMTNPDPAVTIDHGDSHAPYDPDGPNFKPMMFYNEFTQKYKCPHNGCKKSHDSVSAFKQHLKSPVHMEESRKLRCPKCLRYYPNSTALTQHAESQSFRCDIREQGNYTGYIEDFTAKVATVTGRWQDETIRYGALPMGKNKGEPKPEQEQELTAAEAVRKNNEGFLNRQAEAKANFWKNNNMHW